MPIEYKSFDGALDTAGEGSIVAAFSAFDTPDAGNDITLPSFFRDGQAVPMVHDHDWSTVIGKGVIEVGQKAATFNGQLFLDTIAGREAYTTLKHLGDLAQFSYGYTATDTERSSYQGKSVRLLKGGTTHEVSDTLVGMHPATRLVSIKSAAFKRLWDSSYISDLPDSAFAYIAPGGEKDGDGKTTPRSLRSLPHHNADGGIDLPHVRNALARLSQTDIPQAAKDRAEAHLQRHLDASNGNKGFYLSDPEIEGSYEDLSEDISEQFTAQNFAPVGANVCTIATFPGYAYLSVCPPYGMDMPMAEPTYYRVDYTLNDSGDPVLSNPTEVEPSVVFSPADDAGMTFAGQSQKALAAVERLATRTSALAALRQSERKSGKVLSAANHAKLTAVHDGMAGHLAAMAAVLKAHDPGAPATSTETVAKKQLDRRRLWIEHLQNEARMNGVAV